jgi:acyl-CoA thioester hydrolase
MHCQWYLLDRDMERVANTFEFLSAHVSLDTRRTVEFPPDVAGAIDSEIEQCAGLDWDPPLSGALRLRL